MSADLTWAVPDEVDPLRPDILVKGTLKHGLRVVVRPLHMEDRAQLREGFEELSERSRSLRFLTGKGRLSERGLDSLVNEVDGHNHVALALWWPRTSRDDVLLGDARFIRLPFDPECADVAVAIADEIHGQGAATLMLAVLKELALAEGIRRFSAVMSPENEASHRMMLRLGRVVRDTYVDGVREIEVDLTTPAAA